MNRRGFFTVLTAALSGALLSAQAEAQLGVRRRARRRVRRRIRRRIRRRAFTRVVLGRPFWVVPFGMVVGWELLHDNRVVVVKETKIIERDGQKVEVAVVQDDKGKTEEVDILREDNADNAKDLEGSRLADNDKSSPGIESEIEEEVDE
jgi:high-affinity K+ transport system ATPase subunit B